MARTLDHAEEILVYSKVDELIANAGNGSPPCDVVVCLDPGCGDDIGAATWDSLLVAAFAGKPDCMKAAVYGQILAISTRAGARQTRLSWDDCRMKGWRRPDGPMSNDEEWLRGSWVSLYHPGPSGFLNLI